MLKIVKNHYVGISIFLCFIFIIVICLVESPLKNEYVVYNDENFYEVYQNDKININLAEWTDLANLKGIGETKAKAIVMYRQLNGDFESIEDIKNVKGIGQKTFKNLKKYICV